MTQPASTEKEAWARVTNLLENSQKKLGRHWSYNLYTDPKRLAFVLSRYKFASKMACKDKHILELGCSEGIGAPILSEFSASYTGVDLDRVAIETAKANWGSAKHQFIEADFLNQSLGQFDTIVSFDVIEHIYPKYEALFFQTIFDNLNPHGICVISTPNITSAPYASESSQRGHVNLYNADRLIGAMEKIFANVFMFGINDEVIHTGFSPMAHHLIALGCYKRKEMIHD